MALLLQKLFGGAGCEDNVSLLQRILLTMLFTVILLFTLFSDFLPIAFGAYSDQRFLQVAVLVGILFLCLAPLKSHYSISGCFSGTWPSFVVAVSFLACAFPFAGNTFNWVEPGMFAFYFLAFAVMGWWLGVVKLRGFTVRLFVAIALIACFFYAAMTITVFLFAASDRFLSLTDIIPWGFVNMRYWSHIATWLLPILPLALLLKPFAELKKWHWCVGFTAAIWWWIVFMTTARGTMISLALACIVGLVVFGRQLLPWFAIFLKFFVLGVVAWLLLSVAIPSLLYGEVTVRTLHAGSTGRFPLWDEAWQMSLQAFPWGQGPQAWLTHDLISEPDAFALRFGHPHNMYLMWAAEYGWAFMVAFFVLVFTTFKRLICQARRVRAESLDASPLVAFSVAAVAGFAHAGVSAVFVVPASMLVGLCVLGIFWSLINADHQDSPVGAREGERLNRVVIYGTLISGVVVGGSLWSGEVWRYHQAMQEDLVRYEQGPNAAMFPRFWFHGNYPRAEQNAGPAFAVD